MRRGFPREARPRMTYLTVPAACGSSPARILTMINRTIGIDLAIRGDHVAQIHDDGRPVGRPIRFRHETGSLDAFMAQATTGLRTGDTVLAVMASPSWNPPG
uniref:DNA replication protein-like protein n=2 Tax=Cereibacter TaxID=1653176 RepID=A4WTL1_CERS5